MAILDEISVSSSSREQMIDVTGKVAGVLAASGVSDGLCHVYCPHTTGAVAINENADPAVVSDTLSKLQSMVPRDEGYRHAEGNSDAHVKSNLVGTSRTIPIAGGKLVLGTWQSIFFCEFDGPRTRRLVVQIIEG